MAQAYFMGIDTGTNSSKGVIMDDAGKVISVSSTQHEMTNPQPGHYEHDAEKDWQLLLPALADAAAVFLAARAAEGAKIEKDIRGKLAGIEAVTPEIAALSDEDVRARRDKLRDRIGKLLGEEGIVPDEGRLLTECALFADKIAIDEELVRLSSHFSAFRDILDAGGTAGRKLDFLLQEINRETNTIGSKCANLSISRKVVEMKSELEKIREQIQNIE